MKQVLGILHPTLIILFCTCLSFTLQAQKGYDYNPLCQQAYTEIIKLKLSSGQKLIDKAKQQNPDNLIPFYLESYIDFFTLFFNENPQEYQQKKNNIQQRINLLEQGNDSSPFHRYCLSQAYFHKAAIAVKFNENWKAGWAFRKAYQYIKENKKKHSSFSPNQLLYGSLQTVVGTIPQGYSFFASLFGMTGSVTQGMQQVNAYVQSTDAWAKLQHNEALFMYSYLLFYVNNKKDEAFNLVKQERINFAEQQLLAYMAVNLAINHRQPDYARYIIKSLPKNDGHFMSPIWDYEEGIAALLQLDTASAIPALENFCKTFKGNFYKKDAQLKLYWCYFLKGNMPNAEWWRKEVLKNTGFIIADADKQAIKEAGEAGWPNPLLLKARILNDAGNLQEALKLLQPKTAASFTKESEKIEFSYRLARIYDDLKQYDKAIKLYETTIATGIDKPEYFAARSALQLGNIYEKMGNKSVAIQCYEKCLTMKNHGYKNSIDQRAKSGIARCKGE